MMLFVTDKQDEQELAILGVRYYATTVPTTFGPFFELLNRNVLCSPSQLKKSIQHKLPEEMVIVKSTWTCG